MARTDGYIHLTLSVRKRLWFWPAFATVYAVLWCVSPFMNEVRWNDIASSASRWLASKAVKIDVA